MLFEDAYGGTLQDILHLAGIRTEIGGHLYLDARRHMP